MVGDLYRGDPYSGTIATCPVCGMPKQKLTPNGKFVVPVMCECEKARREETMRRNRSAAFLMGLRSLWDEDGFCISGFQEHTFEASDGNDKAAEVCRKYVDNWDEMKRLKCGVLLYGPVGTGKSYMAHAIANALIKRGVRVCVTTMARMIERMHSGGDIVDRLRNYELVVLDDLGAERNTSYGEEVAYSLIDSRYVSGKPVVVTTNLSLGEIKNGNRIGDRIVEMCPITIRMTGPSRRSANAQRTATEARKIFEEDADA